MSSKERFRRAYRLAIGDKEFSSLPAEPLRIAFAIDRDKSRFANKAQVQVYNLAPNTIRSLQSKDGVTVRLEAGYVGEMRQIFFGELRRVFSVREGPNTITTLFGGDGTTPLSSAKIARSFAKGTPVATVLESLVKTLGVGTGNLYQARTVLGARTLATALTLEGPTAEELEDFTRSYGLTWCIQDGAFQIVEAGTPVPGTQGPLLNANSGLVDSPSVDPKTKHVTGKTFLDAALVPGMPFRVDSEFVAGDYVAKKTRHTGDWSQQEWYVEFEGEPIGVGSTFNQLLRSTPGLGIV